MRNDNEIVYRQNMTRNEAVHILKAIAFPIAVFCLGLFTINMFGEFGKKLICPLSGAMWDVGVLVALLMPSVYDQQSKRKGKTRIPWLCRINAGNFSGIRDAMCKCRRNRMVEGKDVQYGLPHRSPRYSQSK